MQARQLTVIVGATALLVAGCGSTETKSETSTGVTIGGTSITITKLPPSSERPSTAMSPEGFGAKPPTSEQLRELGAWIDGPGKGAVGATDAASEGIDPMIQAADEGDAWGLKNACQDVTDPLTIRLPASLPTPDADLNNAMELVVDDAKAMEQACDALGDPWTESQLTAVVDALDQLGTDMKTLGTIMIRDGDLLQSEAGRP